MLNKFTAIDFEMPDNYDRRISAVGVTVVENGKITDSFYSLVNPHVKFNPYIVKLTGITPEMAAKAPDFPEVFEKIRPFITDTVLVAHSAGNDLKVLSRCLKYYGVDFADEVNYICTFETGRVCFPDEISLGLSNLCGKFNIELDHHNPLSDSEGCAKILLEYEKMGLNADEHIHVFDMTTGYRKGTEGKRRRRSIDETLKAMARPADKAEMIKRYPLTDPEKVLGVTEEKIKDYGEKLLKKRTYFAFINNLPHDYFEENLLHAILIEEPVRKRGKVKLGQSLERLGSFLPYADSPYILDDFSPKILQRQDNDVKEFLLDLIAGQNSYAAAFAIRSACKNSISTVWVEELFPVVAALKTKQPHLSRARFDFFVELMSAAPKKTIKFVSSDTFLTKSEKISICEAVLARDNIIQGARLRTEEFLTSLKA